MSISTKIIPIPALQDNYIWLFFDENSKNAWIVDPGEARPVFNTLDDYGLNLAGIFITHHHYDHSGGAKELMHYYKNIPIYASHLSSLPFITLRVKGGDIIACSDKKFNAIDIPGHTLDHTAYYGNGWLFSGDTLFSAGCGKIFEGTAEQMYQSLQKIVALPDETQIFCGHEYTLSNLKFAQHVEPDNDKILDKIHIAQALRDNGKPTLPSTLLDEKNINPFLRCSEPGIIQAAERHTSERLDTPMKVFAKLREWKNNFRTT